MGWFVTLPNELLHVIFESTRAASARGLNHVMPIFQLSRAELVLIQWSLEATHQ